MKHITKIYKKCKKAHIAVAVPPRTPLGAYIAKEMSSLATHEEYNVNDNSQCTL